MIQTPSVLTVELVFAERFGRSLREKYEGADDLWQARVNRDWRFYFRIIGDKYCLVDITSHPK
jgi:hypothetical protein